MRRLPVRRTLRCLLLSFALVVTSFLLPLLSRGDGPPRGDKYALLVRVHQYDKNELRDLPYAEADMEALADVLKKAGYKRVVLLTQTEGGKEARFLPMDANPADKTTLVSLSEVYKDLEKSAAGTRLLLADCCRNDPRSDNARAVD